MSFESKAISNAIQGTSSQLYKEGRSQSKIGREKVESVTFGQRFEHDTTYAGASIHGGWESHAAGDRLPSAANVAAGSYGAPKRDVRAQAGGGEVGKSEGQENSYYAAARESIGDHIESNNPKQLAFLKIWEQKLLERQGTSSSEEQKRNMFIATIGKSDKSIRSIDLQGMPEELRRAFSEALKQMPEEQKIESQPQKDTER